MKSAAECRETAAVGHFHRIYTNSDRPSVRRRWRSENEQVLPLLARAQGVSSAGLLDEMHETLVDSHEATSATIFGALDVDIAPGSGMVFVASHDPLTLLAQLEQCDPGAFEVSHLQRGPDAWRLTMIRTR